MLHALSNDDLPINEWAAANGMEKLTRENTEAYAQYRASRTLKRQTGYNILVAWPGVLDAPGILDVCERQLNESRCGRTLYLRLLKPISFDSVREQNAITANLGRVRNYANQPDKFPSPFQGIPSYEEAKAFLEAYWMVWQLHEDNETDKPQGLYHYVLQALT